MPMTRTLALLLLVAATAPAPPGTPRRPGQGGLVPGLPRSRRPLEAARRAEPRGQVEPYLVKALTEFRNGTRKNEVMSVAAQDLSDVDIANLAAYNSASRST